MTAHHPPVVSVTVRPSRSVQHFLIGIWFLGIVASLGFLMQQTTLWQRVVVLASNLLTGWWAWQYAQQVRRGRLHWDGHAWFWTHFDATPVKKLSVVLDSQNFMLIQLQAQSGQLDWLWLDAGDYQIQWSDLRRALIHAEKRLEWA